VVRRLARVLALAALPGLAALPAFAADPAGAGKPMLTGKRLTAFCADLAGVIAAEAERERAGFPRSLAEALAAMQAQRARKVAAAASEDDDGVLPGPPLEPEDALNAARFLWQRWMPTSPAADLVVVADRPGEWLLGPAPGPDPSGPAAPIRVDKASGKVTWELPHPSERERLHEGLCGGSGTPAGPVPPTP